MHAHENPFRSSRVEALAYRARGGDAVAVLERWEAGGRLGALIGPPGSGKTTLLEQLARRLQREGSQVCLLRAPVRSAERRRFRRQVRAALDARAVLCIDGAERLSWLARRSLIRAARRSAGLITTAHRPGSLPTLHHHTTDASTLEELVAELLAHDGLSASGHRFAALLARHQGNVRECLRELYDVYAAL